MDVRKKLQEAEARAQDTDHGKVHMILPAEEVVALLELVQTTEELLQLSREIPGEADAYNQLEDTIFNLLDQIHKE